MTELTDSYLTKARHSLQRMVLAGEDRDAFLAAIDRKSEPAPRLVKALKRHRRLPG